MGHAPLRTLMRLSCSITAHVLSYLNRGLAYASMDNLLRAMEDFNEAVQRDTSSLSRFSDGAKATMKWGATGRPFRTSIRP